MMNTILFLTSLAGLFLIGESLSCYNCHQDKSPGCNVPISHISTIICSEDTPPVCQRMTRLYSNDTLNVYSRGCSKKISYAKRIFTVESIDANVVYSKKTVNYYCDTDLCNSASRSYYLTQTFCIIIFLIVGKFLII